MTDQQPNTEPTAHCAICGEPDNMHATPQYVGDRYALYSGYNLLLDGDDDASRIVCEWCTDHLGHRGDRYVIVMPEYPDAPERGDIRTVSATVLDGVLTTGRPYAHHESVEPDSPELDLLSARVRGTKLPIEPFQHYSGVPDDCDRWETIDTDWHSTFEPSEVSNRINALTAGDVGIDGPVLVKFGETNNVCSVTYTVQAPVGLTMWSESEHAREPFRNYLTGASKASLATFADD